MKFILINLFIAFYFFHLLPAASIQTSNVLWYVEGSETTRKSYALLDLKWNHAWNNSKNHDGAWVFLKLNRAGSAARHGFVKEDGVRLIQNYLQPKSKMEIKIAEDQVGFFIFPSANFRGDISIRLAVEIDVTKSGNIPTNGTKLEAHAIEVVYIPSSSHFLGEPDSSLARKFNSFYLADDKGNHNGLFQIISENQEIPIQPGSLYYQTTEPPYQGDRSGTLKANYPKGVNSFYCMKYELTQGQYSNFLNSLSPGQTTNRANFGGSQYYKLRGTIYFDGEHYLAKQNDRPCNFISWDDAMAYSDWAGLRPMTELEFSKAARGPNAPTAQAFPWGSSDKLFVGRMIDEAGDLKFQGNLREGLLNDSNLTMFGASYYWVMDLAGSLWERVITTGDEKGRAYTGKHGDGQLTSAGFANVIDWPAGNNETGGFGFRGGGYYSADRAYADFLPFSPVSHRRFAAWSGGERVEAYGSRFVRTN